MDWDDAVLPRIAHLEAVARERAGARAAREMARMFRTLKEQGVPAPAALASIEQAVAQWERAPRPSTRLPLPLARAFVQCGARKLEHLERTGDDPVRIALHGFALDTLTRDVVRMQAEALEPALGAEDAAFCVGIAWQNLHTFWLHPVVGQAHNRNTTEATDALVDAWERVRAPAGSVPFGVVRASEGAPGVLIATSAAGQGPTASLDDSWLPERFMYLPDSRPDRGDEPIPLDTVSGLQRFLALVPLPITPDTLAWILHLVRLPFGAGDGVDVACGEAGLLAAWRPLEGAAPSHAVSAILGGPTPAPEQRASVSLYFGGERVVYAKGELDVR